MNSSYKNSLKILSFFYQELVKSVNDSAHHTDSMGLNRVQHLIHANSFDLLGLSGSFNEHLSVQVVVILGHKFAEISEKL